MENQHLQVLGIRLTGNSMLVMLTYDGYGGLFLRTAEEIYQDKSLLAQLTAEEALQVGYIMAEESANSWIE